YYYCASWDDRLSGPIF
nr:immunoglobulin light chain junction region [Macaca mulatta]